MLSRLRDYLSTPAEWTSKVVVFMRRPVAWGAVLLTYVGIFAAIAFAAVTYQNQNAALDREAHRADAAVVMSGRDTIRNSCEFDNKRTRETKHSLRLFLQDHVQLHNQVNELRARDKLPRDPVHHTNIRAIRVGIQALRTRNCDAEAATLTTRPDREGQ